MKAKRFFRSLFRGTISFLRRLWNWFRHNFGMKIAAVVFAFILWNYVLVTTNPLRDKTITNLPVQVTNAALLQERSLALVEDIASNVKVRVVVQANNDRLSYITEDNVTVTVRIETRKMPENIFLRCSLFIVRPLFMILISIGFNVHFSIFII